MELQLQFSNAFVRQYFNLPFFKCFKSNPWRILKFKCLLEFLFFYLEQFLFVWNWINWFLFIKIKWINETGWVNWHWTGTVYISTRWFFIVYMQERIWKNLGIPHIQLYIDPKTDFKILYNKILQLKTVQ